jgi:uncharacterized membrane protein YfcA
MWTAGVWAALLLSAGVGLTLGLVGGGGSIVTVPVLVYVAGLSPEQAVALSLGIVGATAAVGAVLQYRAGNAELKPALVFGLTGMVGALLGAPLTRLLPGPVLLLLFAALMIGVGLRTLRTRGQGEREEGSECHPVRCAVAGLGVGVLTGFLGVGGGFLIVPALARFARTPMRKAVGTSLIIIAANSAAGFAAHLDDVGRNGPLAVAFTLSALVGLVGGTALGRRMHPKGLRTVFAGLVLTLAAYLVVMNAGPAIGLLARHG